MVPHRAIDIHGGHLVDDLLLVVCLRVERHAQAKFDAEHLRGHATCDW
jgi:hypothetical protein